MYGAGSLEIEGDLPIMTNDFGAEESPVEPTVTEEVCVNQKDYKEEVKETCIGDNSDGQETNFISLKIPRTFLCDPLEGDIETWTKEIEESKELLGFAVNSNQIKSENINNKEKFENCVVNKLELQVEPEKKKLRNKQHKFYICIDCGKDFTTYNDRSRHFLKHLRVCRVERFYCNCPDVPSLPLGESLNNPALYKMKAKHIKEIHVGKVGCNMCHEKFYYINQIDKHKIKCHPFSGDQSSVCPVCGEICIGVKKLKMHIKHCKVASFICECSDLPALGPTQGFEKTLEYERKLQHIQIVHLGEHGCMECLLSFKNMFMLKDHRKMNHQNNLRSEIDTTIIMKCPECLKEIGTDQKPSTQKKMYESHMRLCPVDRFTCQCNDQPKTNQHKKVSRQHPKYFSSQIYFLKQKYKHMISSHDYAIYWCEEVNCAFSFKTVDEQKNHNNLKHNPLNKDKGKPGRPQKMTYICPNCKIDLKKSKKLKQNGVLAFSSHVRWCRVVSFSCDCPDVPAVVIEDVKNRRKKISQKEHHIKVVHFGLRACVNCVNFYLTFESEKELEMHTTEHHSEITSANFKCGQCGKQFNNRSTPVNNDKRLEELFTFHKKVHEVLDFKCNCQDIPQVNVIEEMGLQGLGTKMSTSSQKKVFHMMVIHRGWFGCTQSDGRRQNGGQNCFKTFPTKEELLLHQEHHNKSFPCDKCRFIARQMNTLTNHKLKLHKSNPMKCPKCIVTFKNEYYLQNHTKNVHGSRTACSECGGMYKKMALHIKTVHAKESEKDFQCKECGKGFMAQASLKDHTMNMHLKLQPYQCRFGCEKRYNDKSNRIAHERRRHKAQSEELPKRGQAGIMSI